MEMTTPTVSLVDLSTYLPENRVSADFAGTDELRENFAAAAAVRWGGRT